MQAGLGHRRAHLPPAATELESGFRELRWQPDHFLFMVYRGDGEPAETLRVEEVDPERLRRLRAEIIREWQRDADEKTVAELIAADMLMWKEANSRIFGIVEDGEVVSSAQLNSDGRVARSTTSPRSPTSRAGAMRAPSRRAVEGRSRAGTSSSSSSPTERTGRRSSSPGSGSSRSAPSFARPYSSLSSEGGQRLAEGPRREHVRHKEVACFSRGRGRPPW